MSRMPSESDPVARSFPSVFAFWREQLNLIVPCTIVGLFFWLLGIGPLWLQLLYANGIGYTVRSLIRLLRRIKPQWSMARNTGCSLALVGLIWYLLPLSWYFWQSSPVGQRFIASFNLQLLLIILLVSVAMSYFYYVIEHRHHLQQALLEAALKQTEQDKQLLHQQLKLLQSQIEPHFLFNTLANVQALIRTDQKQASQMLAALTTLLRQSLSQTRVELIALVDELTFSRAYVQIQQIRLGERLHVDWEQAPDLPLQQLVPPLMLQPLLENALQHGIEPVRGPGRLAIRVYCAEQRLTILVINSAPCGDTTTEQTTRKRTCERDDHGIGMSNMLTRLQLHYGNTASLQLSRPTSGQVQVRLEIPL